MNKKQKSLLIEAQNNIDNNPVYAAELLTEVLGEESTFTPLPKPPKPDMDTVKVFQKAMTPEIKKLIVYITNMGNAHKAYDTLKKAMPGLTANTFLKEARAAVNAIMGLLLEEYSKKGSLNISFVDKILKEDAIAQRLGPVREPTFKAAEKAFHKLLDNLNK